MVLSTLGWWRGDRRIPTGHWPKTFTMMVLADHSDVFARLRSGALETLGSHGTDNPDNLKRMRYLRALLNGGVLFY